MTVTATGRFPSERFDRGRLGPPTERLGICDSWRIPAADAAPSSVGVVVYRLRREFLRDRSLVHRFAAAGERASRLLHPNIARVIDVLVERDDVGIVVEWVQGPTLRDLTVRARAANVTVPVWFALQATREICAALVHAHAIADADGEPTPIFHPRLTADRVVLAGRGSIRLTAFGIEDARTLPQVVSAGQRPPGTAGGSTGAPPRAQVTATTADTRRAGRILYELLTLYAGDEEPPAGAGVRPAVRRPVPPPSRLAPWVPRCIDELLRRTLAPLHVADLDTPAALASAIDAVSGELGWQVGGEHLAAFGELLDHVLTGPAPAAPAALDSDRDEPTLPFSIADLGTEVGARAAERPVAVLLASAESARGASALQEPDGVSGSVPAGIAGPERRAAAGPERNAAEAWDAAVTSSRRSSSPPAAGAEDGPDSPELRRGSGAPPAPEGARELPLDRVDAVEESEDRARAHAEFERGFERLREGDVAGAEAAWSLALRLQPDLRAAETNLRRLRLRQSEPAR